jgi:hypothetical protein
MFQTLAWLSAQIRGAQVSAKIATKSNLRRSWYDYNWDWALILLLAFVLLAVSVCRRLRLFRLDLSRNRSGCGASP